MVNILTLKVGDKYSSSVVNELYEGIKSNTTLDFKFYCYTEDTNGLNNNILTIPIKDPLKYKLQWHKLKYHDPKLTKISKGEDCIIMDIDMKILQNIDDILSFPIDSNQIGVFKRWFSDKQHLCEINGGFQKFKMGYTKKLFEIFESDYKTWQEYFIKNELSIGPVSGEQNFIDMNIEKIGLEKKYLHGYWFAKYHEKILKHYLIPRYRYFCKGAFMINGKFNENIKIIHYSRA